MKSTLTTYNTKRNFADTPEPSGKVSSSKATKKLTFVVQRHDASHLHYDFRLELDGVLKSWAVPKGPSLNPKDKRLAMMVEDHPVSYGSFAGVIPKGNYGAGTVEIWDEGTYEPETGTGDPEKALQKGLHAGSLKFVMHGKKLKGSFALVRLKSEKANSWLLIKHKDEFAVSKSYRAEDEPSLTKKKSSLKKAPHSLPGEDVSIPPKKKKTVPLLKSVRSSGKQKLSKFIVPMFAQLGDQPFDDPDWLYEIKWDGYRAIAEVVNGSVSLYSRNGLSFNLLYPAIVEELEKFKDDVILDGEIVVLDKNNRPSFQKLQQYGDHPDVALVYYVFDCLSYQGKDLKSLPLLERKKIAEKVLKKKEVVRYSDHVNGKGKAFFEKIVAMDMEGMIAKRAASLYHPGKRTGDWMKIKHHHTQEAIIAGFTAPCGSRSHLGALLLAIRDGRKLKYIGHTGTGFTERILKELYQKLKPLEVKASPFDEKIPVNGVVTWVKPVLVCEIKFAELTEEGILRQPVFMGLRIDKTAKEANHLDVTPAMKKEKKKTRHPGKISSTKNEAAEEADTEENNKKVKVDGHSLQLTNLNKVYWPQEQITKGQVIDYYNEVYKYILPYLKDRPQSLKRNPNGITDKGFYHKDAGDDAPSWVKSKAIYSDSVHKDIQYIICNNHATLTYLNNLGCIEINPWNSTVRHMDHPDYLIIDLDPSDSNTFDQVIETAQVVKDILDEAGAKGYCKTSGATGLHIYIPLHAQYSYDQIRPFAELIALLTEQRLPDFTTTERSLKKRNGRLYIDHLQNKRGQTLASAYSLRPVPGASVSAPLDWKEVKKGLSPKDFTLFNMSKRLKKTGDLFSGVLTEKINLMKCLKALKKSMKG